MVYRRWNINTVDENISKKLKVELQTTKLLSDILVSRGITDAKEALEFINPTQSLPDPFTLKDMDKLVARVHEAVDTGEKIVVFGDYDVDGISATALMVTSLEGMGAEVYYKLPVRSEDGYGMSKTIIKGLAEKGVTLIITVDNGITSNVEIDYAKELGVDVVVTDHHLPTDVLPNAVAVVDPLRLDDTSEAKKFSGVGVAFMAACAIEGCLPEESLDYYADLVAIGTIADIMQLKGHNRTIVKEGIELLQNSDRAGILALLEKCGLTGKPVTAENISFAISPRLNASGRMNDAVLSLNLLLEEDPDTANEMVEKIEYYNTERQKTEQGIVNELLSEIENNIDKQKNPVLVVWGEGYHQGVLGIVASRLLEKHGKPTIVLTVDEKGEAKGSGRSFEGFSLYDAIASSAHLVDRFGGHKLAAGLSLQKENLEKFETSINEWAKKTYPVLTHKALKADLAVSLKDITVEEIESINFLAPFGQGNPSPILVLKNVRLEAVYPISDGKHTRLKLTQGANNIFAVWFGIKPAELVYNIGDKLDVMLSVSVFQGQKKMISSRIKALRTAGINNDFIENTEIYNSYNIDMNLMKNQLEQICPSRENVIAIYKEIGISKVFKNDLRPVFAKLGEANAGKILIALDVLMELGHIVTKEINGCIVYCKSENIEKKPLSESKILSCLESKIQSK